MDSDGIDDLEEGGGWPAWPSRARERLRDTGLFGRTLCRAQSILARLSRRAVAREGCRARCRLSARRD
jgi:hypothetical protein